MPILIPSSMLGIPQTPNPVLCLLELWWWCPGLISYRPSYHFYRPIYRSIGLNEVMNNFAVSWSDARWSGSSVLKDYPYCRGTFPKSWSSDLFLKFAFICRIIDLIISIRWMFWSQRVYLRFNALLRPEMMIYITCALEREIRRVYVRNRVCPESM